MPRLAQALELGLGLALEQWASRVPAGPVPWRPKVWRPWRALRLPPILMCLSLGVVGPTTANKVPACCLSRSTVATSVAWSWLVEGPAAGCCRPSGQSHMLAAAQRAAAASAHLLRSSHKLGMSTLQEVHPTSAVAWWGDTVCRTNLGAVDGVRALRYGPMPGAGPMLVAGFSQSSAGSFDSDAFPTVPIEKTGNPGAPEPLHDTGAGQPAVAGGGASAGHIPHLHPHHLANFPQHRGSRESFQGVLPNGASPHGNGPSSDSSAAAVAAAAAGVQGVSATTTGLRTAPSFGDYRPPSNAVHPVASLQPRVVRAGVPGYDADAMGYPPMPGRPVGGDTAGGYPPMATSDGGGFAIGTLSGQGDLLSSDSGADYAAMPGATAGMQVGASASGIPPSPGQGVAFGWGGPVASAGDMAARAVARVHAAQAGGAGAAATAAPTPARRSQSHAVASVPPPPEFGRAATSSFVSASGDGLALTERERYEAQIRALQEQLQVGAGSAVVCAS